MEFYKEIKREILEIDNSNKKLKNFGLLIGGILLVFGLYLFIFKDYSLWLAVLGAILIILGEVYPISLKWFNITWMSFAVFLGYFVFRIFMALLFYLMITPIGLIRRLVNGDFLDLKIDKDKKSYWLNRDINIKSDPDRMF